MHKRRDSMKNISWVEKEISLAENGNAENNGCEFILSESIES